MNNPVEYIRFHAAMDLGYVADVTHGGYQQQQWTPGEPERSFWTGLKSKKKIKSLQS